MFTPSPRPLKILSLHQRSNKQPTTHSTHWETFNNEQTKQNQKKKHATTSFLSLFFLFHRDSKKTFSLTASHGILGNILQKRRVNNFSLSITEAEKKQKWRDSTWKKNYRDTERETEIWVGWDRVNRETELVRPSWQKALCCGVRN